MIYYFFALITLIFFLIIQIFVSMYLPFLGLIPEFVLVGLIYFSLKNGNILGEMLGFFAGLFMDIFTIHIFGLKTMIFTILGFFMGRLSNKLDESMIRVQVIVVFLSIVFYMLSTKIIYGILLYGKFEIKFTFILANAIYSSLLTPFLFEIMNKWNKKLEKWSGKASRI